MDELSSKDYVIADHFIREDIFSNVRSSFITHLPAFTEAGIGALQENVIRHDIRSDQTYWLERKRDVELEAFWQLLDEAIYMFNRYCFLSLSGFGFHFANYPAGSKYAKHLDQFQNRNNRMITMVIYLNEDWKKVMVENWRFF